MANNFFQFKQFTIQQQFCAMKVSTDACIFGAAVAEIFAAKALPDEDKEIHYLDIGTGTGLLSLMLAQKTTAFIDAVEIDSAAYDEASKNFNLSPFKERLSIYNTDILNYRAAKKYEGIICNPPFFEGDLRSPDKKKNAAKHDTTLTLQQLLKIADSHIKVNGLLAVLLPYHRVDEFIKDAVDMHFGLKEKILLRHTAAHPYFRGILFFSKTKTTSAIKELVIKEAGNYTDECMCLLKDYYLYL